MEKVWFHDCDATPFYLFVFNFYFLRLFLSNDGLNE